MYCIRLGVIIIMWPTSWLHSFSVVHKSSSRGLIVKCPLCTLQNPVGRSRSPRYFLPTLLRVAILWIRTYYFCHCFSSTIF